MQLGILEGFDGAVDGNDGSILESNLVRLLITDRNNISTDRVIALVSTL